ncbi:MAG TPA: hypothetical protein VFQ44_02100 [Streptosporangiaceae bacterium]|nr:hypothetical protein [Streptosporangiaceae bacterium]
MRQVKGTDEQDAFTGWRRVMPWHPGQLRKVKRRSSKRERRNGKDAIAAQRDS